MRAHLSDARVRDNRIVLSVLGCLVRETDTTVLENSLIRGYMRARQVVVLNCAKLKAIDPFGLEFLRKMQARFATAEGAQLILENVPDLDAASKAS
jgi:ABC-type transporter Mla MlaB component